MQNKSAIKGGQKSQDNANINPISSEKKKTSTIDSQTKKKPFEDTQVYSSDSSEDYMESSDEIISLEKLQMKNNKKPEEIIIKKTDSKTNVNVSLEEIRTYFKDKNYDHLKKYEFPYMKLSRFNDDISRITIKEFRELYFYCPICNQRYRQYSIPFHIFQFHFDEIHKYLNPKEIANCCAMLMNKQYKKIDKAIKIYSYLAILFDGCDYKGNNEEIFNANNSLDIIKNLYISKSYFNLSIEEAKNNLRKILPINKNRNKIRSYKPRKRKKEK